LLLDTHIAIRWLVQPKRLSSEQRRVLRRAADQGLQFGVSAMSLLEIAIKFRIGGEAGTARDLLALVETSPVIQILPLTTEIALDLMGLTQVLRDPVDSAIVATARVHGLKLLTSDQRIIQSKLVSVIE
jgi:PIN domain nuclease of toxin-antitoxin system